MSRFLMLDGFSRREFFRRAACMVPVGALGLRGKPIGAAGQTAPRTARERAGVGHWSITDVDPDKQKNSVRLASTTRNTHVHLG